MGLFIALTLVIGYLLGNLNGAVWVSHLMKDDVRTHGSGNAGLTNFIRSYGAKHALLVIAVDALASRSVRRLCRTIQLSDTGITPGSGVGNHRHALTKETLRVPVIAIGVPTVVDAATLAADLLDLDEPPRLYGDQQLLVTTRDIDSQSAELSRIIGYAVSLALQPGLTVEDLEMMLN